MRVVRETTLKVVYRRQGGRDVSYDRHTGRD